MDFRPVDVVGHLKKRYGREEDGGYVIIDNAFGATHLLGYGVDKEVSFENQLTSSWGIGAHIFDHTIHETPETGPAVTYVKEGLGPSDAAPLFTLQNHVDRFVPAGTNFVLKMDIEGAEWAVLARADLSRVTQLVIEFHDLQDDHSDVIAQLNKQFYLVHVHGNNCHNQPVIYIDRVHKLPRYLECTYVRKDLVEVVPTIQKYPTPLDFKCRKDAPDVPHDWWEPCNKPISFVVEDGTDVTLLKKIMTREDEIVYKFEDAKLPRKFVISKRDVFPYELIMNLYHVPDVNVVFPIRINYALVSKMHRFHFPSNEWAEAQTSIYTVV